MGPQSGPQGGAGHFRPLGINDNVTFPSQGPAQGLPQEHLVPMEVPGKAGRLAHPVNDQARTERKLSEGGTPGVGGYQLGRRAALSQEPTKLAKMRVDTRAAFWAHDGGNE